MQFTTVAVVSYRLGTLDGVSVEAAKWVGALRRLGLAVTTIAGEGDADRLVAGLGAWDRVPVDEPGLRAALAGADVVVADNICSLPLNPAASAAVARALRGRPAVLRHHDLPWQRRGFTTGVPDHHRWLHVTVNELSRRQLARRGMRAVTVRNRFDPAPPAGDREGVRRVLGVAPDELLALQPTRAIPRKNVPAGLAVARAIGAAYWLTGTAEEDYGPVLARLLDGARRVIHRPAPGGLADHDRVMADAYAAADVVLLPSTWEGFGNPAVEASLHGRPVVVGPYPVAGELAGLGFRWFGLDEIAGLRHRLVHPAGRDRARCAHNLAVARERLSLEGLPARLETVLTEVARLSARPGRSGASAGGGSPARASATSAT